MGKNKKVVPDETLETTEEIIDNGTELATTELTEEVEEEIVLEVKKSKKSKKIEEKEEETDIEEPNGEVYPKNKYFGKVKVFKYRKDVIASGKELIEIFLDDGTARHIENLSELSTK